MKDVIYSIRGSKTMFEMTWPEVQKLKEKTDVAIVTIGSFEQHGTHMPMATDTLQGLEVAKDSADMLSKEGIVVAVGPVIPFGVNPGALAFPGSITLSPDTLKKVIVEVCLSLKNHGFKNIALLVAHDENIPAMTVAAQELVYYHSMKVITLNKLPYVKLHEKEILDLKYADGHGGAGETSRMMARFPSLVDLENSRAYRISKRSSSDDIPFSGPPLLGGGVYSPANDLSGFKPPEHPGIVGEPKMANAEAGERAFTFAAKWVAEIIKREFFNKNKGVN